MTDEEMIAALGWQECVLDTWDKQCLSHDYAHDDENGLRCDWLAFRLIGARAGIDLARVGIADMLHAEANTWMGPSVVLDMFALIEGKTREWQP